MIALRKDNIDLVSGSPARGALNACHFRDRFLPSLGEAQCNGEKDETDKDPKENIFVHMAVQ